MSQITESENKSILEEELQPVFMNFEEISLKKATIDYSKVYVLPTIKTRYSSMLIDIVIMLIIAIGISSLFENIGDVPDYVRGILFVMVFVLYEPILVSFGATIGQLLMNIRVKKFKNPSQKIAFPLLIIRLLVKALLGWISFITVTFDINRRAIHDFACGSIMVANKIE